MVVYPILFKYVTLGFFPIQLDLVNICEALNFECVVQCVMPIFEYDFVPKNVCLSISTTLSASV